MLFCHTGSSRGKNVCLGALSWVGTNIIIIATTMNKSFCSKYKLFYRGMTSSEFQISSAVGEIKDTTQPFHPMGPNCTCSTHPIHLHFPSLSLFHTPKTWLFKFYAPGASCDSKNSNRNHNHNSHNPKQPSRDALNFFQLHKTMAKPPLIAMGADFSCFWTN